MKNLKSVDIQRLPPVEDAAKYHSYRVYLLSQIWMGNTNIAVEDLGCNVQFGYRMPELIDCKPDPDVLSKS